jgi:hypothetical protein
VVVSVTVMSALLVTVVGVADFQNALDADV